MNEMRNIKEIVNEISKLNDIRKRYLLNTLRTSLRKKEEKTFSFRT